MTGRAPTTAAAPASAVVSDEAVTLERAVWTTAEINDLPDSSFAVISKGGKKDADGKTTPRNLRHLPFKGPDGKVDLPHLRNALSRLPQSNLSDEDKATAERVLNAAAKEAGVGEEGDDDGERAAAAPTASERAGLLYAPFVRRDDAKWEVEGVLTSEAIDTYGTIFDYESAKRAVAEWAGNVREQHDIRKAVGRRVEYDCDDANKLVRLRVRVSKGAPDTWAKVCDGTLTGFSIGAYDALRETRSVNGRTVPVYRDYKYGEVSLVDVPSNPDAAGSGLAICRVAGLGADGALEWNDALLARFDADGDASSDASSDEAEADAADGAAVEQPVAPEPTDVPVVEPVVELPAEAPASAPADEPAAERVAAAPTAPSPAASGAPAAPSLAELERVFGPLSEEQRAQITRAAALIHTEGVVIAASGQAVPPRVTPALIVRADGSHDAFTGTHRHAHSAFGSQGGDDMHEHEHSHDGDANHQHSHAEAADADAGDGERAVAGDAALTRAGAAKPKVSPADQKVNAAITEVSAALEALKAAQAADEASAGRSVSAGDKAVDSAIQQAYAALAKIRDAQDADIAADPAHAEDNAEDEERAVADAPLTAVLASDAATATLERAGQRISAATRDALHQSAAQVLLICGCPVCMDAAALLNPDADDDEDADDADAADAGEDDAAARARHAHLLRLQRVKLTRATRKSVAVEVERQLTPLVHQFRAIAARLTSVKSGSDGSTGNETSAEANHSVLSQLDEVRASLGAVQGLVEQIAKQPAPGGPILRAADKTLGLAASPQALDASAGAPIPHDLTPEQLVAAVRQLQRAGALGGQDAQVNAAATILQQQMRGAR